MLEDARTSQTDDDLLQIDRKFKLSLCRPTLDDVRASVNELGSDYVL